MIALGIGMAIRGVKTDFDKHLDKGKLSARGFGALRRLGQVGYVARGLVIALVGGFIVKAAIDHQPGKAQGLDVALQSVADAPFGKFLLLVAAAGLVCFGVYSFAEARYRRL